MEKGYKEGDQRTKRVDVLIGGIGSIILALFGILVAVFTSNSAATTLVIIIMVALLVLGTLFALLYQRYYIALGVAAVFIGLPIIAFGLVIGSCFFHPF